ncbi:MAG TPA: PaaI family thioesterase [Actinocrinis sp.]|nr:PaaI family thioesterase [Actinocrinis sp.]
MSNADTAQAAVGPTVPPPGALEPVRHPDAPAPGTDLGPHYAHCFGCGDHLPNGLHLQVFAGQGVDVSARFEVTEAHQGAPGLAHGGLLACAFDEALGSVNWLLRVPAVTGRLETDYLRPVPVGSVVHITARCVAVAGRKVYLRAEGRINGPDGELAARAAALFVQVKLTHFTTHGRAAEVETVLADTERHRSLRAFEINP